MAVRTGPTNYQLQMLLQELDVQARNSPFWRKVADDLRKPARQRRVVNIYRIEKAALEGETVLVPGKVLSVGELNKKLSVAALTFSKDAAQKITDAKGKVLSIMDLVKQNPEGKKVRIVG